MHAPLRGLASRLLVLYGYYMPYHPGKWRVIDAVSGTFDLSRLSDTLRVVTRRGLRFALDTRSYLDRTLYYLGCHELVDTRFMESVLQPGSVVCDVGANLGWFTLCAARELQGEGCIYAFEPAPDEFERLERNVALNRFPNVVLHRVAMTDREGSVWLTETRDAGTTRITDSASGAAREVPATTLDDFVECADLVRLDFVKVDIEGAEVRFLRGAERTLRRLKPIMMIEIHPGNLATFDSTPEEVFETLSTLGYETYRATRRGLSALSAFPSDRTFFNVIAIPRHATMPRADEHPA